MNQVIDALMSRRSCRAYKPDAIPAGTLEQIAQCGLYAPSAMNRQPWHISVISDAALIAEINGICKEKALASGNERMIERASQPGFDLFYGAPVLIIVSGDMQNKFAEGDCSSAVENMALAAHALGLGSCIIAMFRPAYEGNADLARRTGIPDSFTPLFSLAVGVRAQPDNAPSPRRENTLTYVK